MRIRSLLRWFATIVMAIALVVVVISALDLRNALPAFSAAVGAILLAGLLWMLTEISEQLAELPEDLAEPREEISVASGAAPQKLPPRRA